MRMIDPLKGYRRTLARAAQAAKRFEPATDRQEWRGQYRRIVGERNPGGRIRKNRRIGDRFSQWCIHRMMAEEPNNRRHSARSVTSFSGDSLTQELASILDCGLREVEKAWAKPLAETERARYRRQCRIPLPCFPRYRAEPPQQS